tara:strand:+ start:8776 stop:9654 length:879 start_codon:yes stop_codon:yes gene_type:complete
MVDMAMVEEKNEEVEAKDPWDFEDPEVMDVPAVRPDEFESDTDVSEEDLPDEILQRAKDAGLVDEDLANMGSPEQVEFVLGLLETKVQQVTEEAKDSAIKSGDATDEDQPSNDVSWIDDIDPDDAVDSDTARAMKAMKSKIDELTGTMESMNKKTEEVKTNSYFTDLDPEWEEVFGSKSSATDEQTSNRKSILEEVETLKDGYRSRKKRLPTDKNLFDRAVNGVFGEQAKDFARQELNERLQKRESQFLSRASTSSATGDMISGRQQALKNVSNKMRELGLDVVDETSDIFE